MPQAGAGQNVSLVGQTTAFQQAGAGQMPNSAAFDVTRWRSFAERYLIERASTFEPGKELEGIWQETNNALTAYQHVYHVGAANEGKDIAIPAAVPALPLPTDVKQRMEALTLSSEDKAWYMGLLAKVRAW